MAWLTRRQRAGAAGVPAKGTPVSVRDAGLAGHLLLATSCWLQPRLLPL